jgi:hypothetical protein
MQGEAIPSNATPNNKRISDEIPPIRKQKRAKKTNQPAPDPPEELAGVGELDRDQSDGSGGESELDEDFRVQEFYGMASKSSIMTDWWVS